MTPLPEPNPHQRPAFPPRPTDAPDDTYPETPIARTSVEKLRELLSGALGSDGGDAKTRQLRATMKAIMPIVNRIAPIPDDPGQLDAMLLLGARLCLRLRSDGADPPPTLEDLIADAPAWLVGDDDDQGEEQA